ncbi:MAG: hypothetical protein ABR576_15355 [Thermoanaerobaculia bacterium]
MVRALLVLAGLPLLASAARGLDGAPVWEQRWVAQTLAGGRPLAVRELADGSIFVLAAAGSELAGVRYNHLGSIVSTSILTVPHLNFFGLPNTQTRFAIDPFGGVFVAAVSDVELTRGDIWVMKYDGFSGKPMWAAPRVLDTVPPFQDAPLQILVDHRGNAVVVGFSEGGSSERIAVLIEYDGVTGATACGPRTIHPATRITAALDPSDAVILSLSTRQDTGAGRDSTRTSRS